jgi:hypothetical protein
MIGIRVGDEFLDVATDTKVSLTLMNPLFNEDNLSPGSFSFPFDLPGENVSPKNSRVLSNPDVMENLMGSRKFDSELLIRDILIQQGKLVVSDAPEGKITSNFLFGLNTVSTDFKTKKIRDLIAETITISANPVGKAVYLKPGVGVVAPFALQINGNSFSSVDLPTLTADINVDTNEPKAKCTYVAAGFTPGGIAAPFLKIEPFVNPGDPVSQLSVTASDENANAWVYEAFDMTTYYNQFRDFLAPYWSGVPPDDKIRFPFVFNEGIQDPPIKSRNFVNGKGAAGLVTNKITTGVFALSSFLIDNKNSVQPFIRLRYVLDKILEYFNLEIDGDWVNADVNNMLIWNTTPLDTPMDFIGNKQFLFWNRTIDVSLLVPDLTVLDFLKALQNRYNLGIYFVNGKMRIVKREAIAKRLLTYNDITSLAGRIVGKPDYRVTGVALRAPRDDKDFISVVDEFTVGVAETIYETQLSGMGTSDNIQFYLDGNLITGFKAQQKQLEKFNLRVFYDKGMVGDVYEYNGASVNATTYNEQFAGVNGVYEKFWKYWLHFEIRRRGVKLPVRYGVRHLNKIDWEMKQVIDRKRYLIKEIDVEVTATGLSVSNVELYTMF